MDLKEYLDFINEKTDKINKKAKNPFLEQNFAYNPFISAIEQTYVWVENNAKPFNFNNKSGFKKGL